MCKCQCVKKLALLAVGGMVLAGVMGQGCLPPGPSGEPVTIELTNLTADPVDAFLWADPGTLFTPEEVAIDANFIDIGEPLASGDMVTVTLDCVDAGTLLVDGDVVVLPAPVASSNLLLLREGEHFVCGDVVSFFYEIDPATGTFFISADVNDVNIAP